MKESTRRMMDTLHSYHNQKTEGNDQAYRNRLAKMFRGARRKASVRKWWIPFLRNGGNSQ